MEALSGLAAPSSFFTEYSLRLGSGCKAIPTEEHCGIGNTPLLFVDEDDTVTLVPSEWLPD
jgi:hypothetical protein